MIESLLLENFQTHEKRLFEFSPQVTCLVGPTDSGKSSALRGLLWCLLNPFRGDWFISHWSDWSRSTLLVDNHTVVRYRGKGENYYELDGNRYEAFGSNVPEDIQKVLNTDPISVQSQLDSPFWFLLSPGEVSRELNRVVNLTLIDQVLSSALTSHKKVKTTLQVSTDRLYEARARRDDLQWVLPLSDQIGVLEDLERQIEDGQQEADTLKEILNQLAETDRKEKGAESILLHLEEVVRMGEEIQKSKETSEVIRSVLQELEENDRKLKRSQEAIGILIDQIREMVNDRCPLCGQEKETEWLLEESCHE